MFAQATRGKRHIGSRSYDKPGLVAFQLETVETLAFSMNLTYVLVLQVTFKWLILSC
jgi:hypothetical protein